MKEAVFYAVVFVFLTLAISSGANILIMLSSKTTFLISLDGGKGRA